MAQALKGYFQGGQFVPLEAVVIPDNVEVYVVVTGNLLSGIKTKVQKQREAFEEFTQSVLEAEPLGEEFDKIISQGINLRGELKL